MTASTPSLFARPDTLLGVCEGLGQDFGFNPRWPRIAFAVTIFWSPLVALAVYLGLGVAVLASRLAFPTRAVTAMQSTDLAPAGNDDHGFVFADAA